MVSTEVIPIALERKPILRKNTPSLLSKANISVCRETNQSPVFYFLNTSTEILCVFERLIDQEFCGHCKWTLTTAL